ncbi:PD40 domain-containing protein [Paenibacillus alvei]|uniref:Translocation protein TolB n=1 Tax=Paenibacillus alvei TaxID=44250 RepID=A0AAP7DH77_PAEAL|nr:PD40 domain-containing protein [Paenibacillus alvei]MBG9735669.1 hypothetical protein [Paenibacillus alvei]MBG9746601.1 hypothetical protein [Paenibacillus alvei]MCY9578360.1 PD40 domain-containing protein [Paenibacillus alvei]MCY9584681.1 PD40 domain-containing protein [Paenibacillus alvei]NOJ70253.1 hypothetical protein [Paenibacillus alvei]
MKSYIHALFVLLMLFVWAAPSSGWTRIQPYTAAFIRDNDLWITSGTQEKRITTGEYIRNPKWSFDGKWVAFTKGKEQQEVWAYHTVTKSLRRIGEGENVQWSPKYSILAFQTNNTLRIANVDTPATPIITTIADQIGNYAWNPSGNGLLVSTLSKLLPNGKWEDIYLYNMRLEAGSSAPNKELLYRISNQTDDFFAVLTSTFKWSPDGKWIAFIAIPTASLSADDNTLCLLSADGKTFIKIGNMLHNTNWFNWAPKSDKLAYIAGVGREATSNKKLTVVKEPFPLNQRSYTPDGRVDTDFTWRDNHTIIASRATEAQWTSNPDKRPLPELVFIDLDTGVQAKLTAPPTGYGDYYPLFVEDGRKLSWIRTNRSTAEVMLSSPDGKHMHVWIPDLTLGTNYYERWNWSEVFQPYNTSTN